MKRGRIKQVLRERAVQQDGDDATALDYVVSWVATGRTILDLAASLQVEMGEGVSRSFLSRVVNRLTPDARAQLIEARRRGADALREEALRIAHACEPNQLAIAQARMHIDQLLWMAERWERASPPRARAVPSALATRI